MAKTKTEVSTSEYIFMERLSLGLRCIGLRVNENDSPWLKIILNVVMLVAMVSFIACQLIAATMCKSLSCVVSNFGDNLLFVLNLYTYIAYLYVWRMADPLIAQLKRLMAEFGTEKETLKIDKMLNTFVLWYEIYLVCLTTSFNMYPVTTYKECLEKNNSAAYVQSCGMPVASWFPWDETITPGLQLSWLYQYLAGAISTTATLFPGLIVISHICHTYIQFKVLEKNIIAIKDVDPTARSVAFRRCIKHHMAILDYGENVSHFFNMVNYAQQTIMAVLISCIGYKLLEMVFLTGIDPMNFMRYLMEWMALQVYLLIIGTLGQEMMDASIEIGSIAYDMPWYEESKEFKTLLYILVMRTREPVVVKSMNLTVLCRNSIVALLRTIYSFLSLFATLILTDN